MKKYFLGLVVGFLSLMVLTACSFVAEQLSDKANEEKLLKPGALDSPVATNFNVYHYKFLDRYRVIHAWPVTSACKYAQLSTQHYKMGEISYGGVKIVSDIHEQDNHTWQRFEDGDPPSNFDRFVRPTYTTKNDERDPITGIKTGREIDRQHVGFDPLCFEAWVKTSHTLIFRLHKRDIGTWKKLWTGYNPTGKWSQKQVGATQWWAMENAPSDLHSTGTGGWFQSYLTAIADTGYSISIQLGATQESLKYPKDHAKFQTMFRHLIESVKIERLSPAIEAEIAELKAKAKAISADDCRMFSGSPPPLVREVFKALSILPIQPR